MASLSRKKGSAKVFRPEDGMLPGFFKGVVSEALEDGMLEIEGYVSMNYEDFLGRSLSLIDPNGELWPIELKRSNGSVWLKKGWLEFANFYSLEQGCYILFTHIGVNSGFQVRIFNKGMLEIDYPLKSSHPTPEFSTGEILRTEGDDAFTRALRFRSNHPYVAVKMQPSYMTKGLNLNAKFVNANICATGKSRKIKLQNTHGRTWSGKCIIFLYRKKTYAKICAGWTKFAAGNDLQVGDACVLELIKKHPEPTLWVHIFRAK